MCPVILLFCAGTEVLRYDGFRASMLLRDKIVLTADLEAPQLGALPSVVTVHGLVCDQLVASLC